MASPISKEVRLLSESWAWVSENMERLKRNYPGEYVAVLGGRLVGHSRDYHGLLARLWSKGFFPGPLVITRVPGE